MVNKKRTILTPSRVFMQGFLVKNPILVQVIGLCPAVAASADIIVSAVLSAHVLILLLLCESIASLFLKKLPRSVRVGIYFLIGLSLCTATTYYAEEYRPELLQHAGVYLPLMAASSVVALRSETFAVKHSFRLSFVDAFANGLGTTLVLVLTGFVRGLLGNGQIGHIRVLETAPLRGLAMPFGGFIVLGFMAAFLKWFISRFLKNYDEQMQFGIRKKKKKKPVPAVQTSVPETTAPETNAPKAPESENKGAEEKASEEGKPVSHMVAETPSGNSEESHAADFYEQAASETESDLDMTLLMDDGFSIEAEFESILESIDSFESILDQTRKEENDA